MSYAISPIDFPVIDGNPVTQAHADYCAANGHATWTSNGIDKGICPRCNTVTAPANHPAVGTIADDCMCVTVRCTGECRRPIDVVEPTPAIPAPAIPAPAAAEPTESNIGTPHTLAFFHVGVNIPGYLCDDAPYCVQGLESALDGLGEEIDRSTDGEAVLIRSVATEAIHATGGYSVVHRGYVHWIAPCTNPDECGDEHRAYAG